MDCGCDQKCGEGGQLRGKALRSKVPLRVGIGGYGRLRILRIAETDGRREAVQPLGGVGRKDVRKVGCGLDLVVSVDAKTRFPVALFSFESEVE